MKCSSWLNILCHTRKCKIHFLALFSVSFVKINNVCTNKINDIYLKYDVYNFCDHLLGGDILHSKHRTEGVNIANFQVSLPDNPYNNALQIPRHFEVALLHHSDHTIYITKPRVHWKLVLNETLSWCIFSSFFFLKQIHIFCEETGFLTYS